MKTGSKIIAGAAALLFVSSAAFASPFGTYQRPNGTTARVWDCGGKMCAKMKNTGFNIFLKGLKKTKSGIWKGKMKNPKLGPIFTFNGTARQIGDNKLRVKGRLVGSSTWDAETWTKK